MESRIVDWLSDDNLVIAFGKSREEIFDIFGNELEPIAYVPARFIPLLGSSIKDARIYCGMGYFIDHALRNHGKHGHQIPVEDIDVSKYLNIQAVLDNPDAIKETIVDGKRTVVFIKKIGRFFAELAQVEEKGKIVLHKSLFDQKKEPYVKLNDIRQKGTSSEGGDSSISHEGQTSPAISLESRGDVESESKLQTAASKPHGLASERKDNNSASEKQGNGEKSSAQFPDSEQGGKLANDGNHELDDLDTSAIAERIDIADDDWTEGEGNNPTYKRTITIDGKYKVIQVDEPDSNGFYAGSYFEYNGERFGDLAEVANYIDKRNDESASSQGSGTDHKSVKPIDDNSKVGRSLSEQEATDLITRMEANAEVAPAIELTPENWITQFGEDGTVDTPLGTVKMGANQLLKLYSLKRTECFGMIYPTLNSPDVILEEADPKEGSERDSKYLFIKTFVKSDGTRIVHFESVTVKKDGMEVSISSHEIKDKSLKNKMQNDIVLHLDEKLSPSSEMRLTETPSEPEGPDLVPTSDNVISSDRKVNTLSADKQADSVESSEPYTITPAVYVGKSRGNKPSKETPMHRVTFNRPLTEEQERAVKAFANETIGEKKGRFATKRGWADREAADFPAV